MVWRVGLVGRSWAGRKSSVLREEEEECHFSTTRPALLVKMLDLYFHTTMLAPAKQRLLLIKVE